MRDPRPARLAASVLLAALCLPTAFAGPAAAGRAVAGRAAPPRPNVVVILMDDLGYGDVACFGAPDARTPNVDGLARDGVRMTDNYSAAPVCSPTRAAFLTGRYQQRCGIEAAINSVRNKEVGLPTSETALPRMLKTAGYRTALFGKWHLGTATKFGPNAHGFDEFFGALSSVDYFEHRNRGGEYLLYENTSPVTAPGYLTDALTDRAVDFVDRAASSGDPFFLEVAYTAVHVPHQDPDDPTDLRTKATWGRSTREIYVKMLERADAGVGRILDALARRGLDGSTLVVFASDNGAEVAKDGRNAPLRGGKSGLEEGGLRSPTVVRWTGVLPAGRVCRQVSVSMDLTATILAAAGVAPPRPLDGVDLLPVLRGEAPEFERALFWRDACARHGAAYAARLGRWKYVRQGGGAAALYDLDADVGETRDVADANRDVVRDLERRIAAWQRDVDATPHATEFRCH